MEIVMDYEKFHNETLRNLQEMVSKGKITEAVAKGICADFVAESKDEKIRKEIAVMVNFFYGTNLAFKHSFSKNEMLAWLEKQKGTEREIEGNSLCNSEQKPVNRLKTTAGNWYVCEIEVMNENMTTAFHCGEVYYCPKDGYIDVNGALFEVGTLDVFRLATKEEIPQPKQEWSEEDEGMLYGVIETEQYMLDVVNGIQKFDVGNGSIRKECAEELNWLKSLKDRCLPQPKQEWSEKDEEMLSCISCLLEEQSKPNYNGSTFWTKEQLTRWNNWLKSLRPKNTWKPSIAQLNALSIVSKGNVPDDIEAIVSLYNDLKKLREE